MEYDFDKVLSAKEHIARQLQVQFDERAPSKEGVEKAEEIANAGPVPLRLNLLLINYRLNKPK